MAKTPPVIPGSGDYLQDLLTAKSAYDRAVAMLKSQRQQRQIQSGLGKDWSVDPKAQYGTYQAMLQSQGLGLEQAAESAQERGFFGRGLGNQPESLMRYGQAVQSLGFKNQLSDWENEYQVGMVNAKRQKELEDLYTMQGSYGDAVNNQNWGEPIYGGMADQGQPPGVSTIPQRYSPVRGSIQGASRNPYARKQPIVRSALNNRQNAGRM